MDPIEVLKAKAWEALRNLEKEAANLAASDAYKAHQAAEKSFQQIKVDLAKAEELIGGPSNC